MPSGEILTYPEDTAASSSDYVATEKVSGGFVFRQKTQTSNLKVLPTGGTTDRTLAAVALAVEKATANSATVGGIVFADVATSDAITAATSANAFVSFAQTYAVPASTIKAGTVVKIRAMVDVTNAAAGSATLTCNIRLGGTSLIATTAVDPAANDFHILEFIIVGRAAPAAAAALVGYGSWYTSTGGTNVTKAAILQSTNFATNGALTIDVQAKWSASDATTTAQLEFLTVEII
jgi:hypothetical protein